MNEQKQSHKDIYVAFWAAQQKMPKAVKNSTNPYHKSRYADLNSVQDAVMPALTEEGIMVIQSGIYIDGKNYLRTTLRHVESGTEINSDIEIIMLPGSNPQHLGSSITYVRRYGLQSICGIGAEDDDANAAAGKTAPAQPAAVKSQDTGQSVSAGKKAFTKSMITENFLLWLNAELERTNTSLWNVLDHHFAMFTEDKQAVAAALENFKNRQQNG